MASTLQQQTDQRQQDQNQQQLQPDYQPEHQQQHGRQCRRATVHADRDLLTIDRALDANQRRGSRSGSGSSGGGGGEIDEYDLFCRLAHSPTGLGAVRPTPSGSPRAPQQQLLLSASPPHWAEAEAKAAAEEARGSECHELGLEWIGATLRQVEEEEEAPPRCHTAEEEGEEGEEEADEDRGEPCRIRKYRSRSYKQPRKESSAATTSTTVITAGAVSWDASEIGVRPRACSTGMAGLPMGGNSGRRIHYSSVRERRDVQPQQQQFEAQELTQNFQQQQLHQVMRVRSFKRTKHGLVNQGDSVLSGRSSCSSSSAAGSDQELRAAHQAAAAAAVIAAAAAERRRSSGGSSAGSSGAAAAAAAAAVAAAVASAAAAAVAVAVTAATDAPATGSSGRLPDHACQFYRVQVMGAPRVGKSTLCSQFLSSENHMLDSGADDDLLDESHEKFVPVLLDTEEYLMTFLDTEAASEPQNTIVMDVDAYMIVFAVDNRHSFGFAKQILNELVSEARKSSALILVANKSDLVRNRDVTHDEAKNLASVYGAKYFEISTALNHNVDELLVSILSQIKAQQKRIEKEKSKLISREKDGHGLRASLKLRSPRQVLGNFFRKHFQSKSHEHLDPQQS